MIIEYFLIVFGGVMVGFALRGLIDAYLNRNTPGYKTVWERKK